jgi:pyrroloquinoline quinone (PQQ) biosynthesis protein C
MQMGNESPGSERVTGLTVVTPAQPVDIFMIGLQTLQAEICQTPNRVVEAVLDGTLSIHLLRRLAMEYHSRWRHYTTEFATLASLAPDADTVPAGWTEHFEQWLQNLAYQSNLTGDLGVRLTWAHQLGLTDEDLAAYRPTAETIGAVFTTLYYMRHSYEEGLAAFGWAGMRLATASGYAREMYAGLRDHYGIETETFREHASAEENQVEATDYLLRQVVVTADQQERVRRAVEDVFICQDARAVALNRWLEEPGALR